MSTFTVGLLSPGDMGHVVGQVAIASGARVITCLNGRSERTRKLAEIAGIEDIPTYSDLVREALTRNLHSRTRSSRVGSRSRS